MVDVTTPATYYRYTNNWNGSIQGWDQENLFQRNPFSKQMKTLENFYLSGHWVEPGGGVPTAFKSGRDVAQIICKDVNMKFIRKCARSWYEQKAVAILLTLLYLGINDIRLGPSARNRF